MSAQHKFKLPNQKIVVAGWIDQLLGKLAKPAAELTETELGNLLSSDIARMPASDQNVILPGLNKFWENNSALRPHILNDVIYNRNPAGELSNVDYYGTAKNISEGLENRVNTVPIKTWQSFKQNFANPSAYLNQIRSLLPYGIDP